MVGLENKRVYFYFSFAIKSKSEDGVSKRINLPLASSLFAVLGLFASLIANPRIILQELWIIQIAWNDSLPQYLQTS